MRRTLSDLAIANLKPSDKRYAKPDPELRNGYVRVQPTGVKTYWVIVPDPNGKQRWRRVDTVGPSGALKVAEARELARNMIKRIRAGLPATEAPAVKPHSFQDVAASYLKRHVTAKKLRSAAEIKRILTAYVYPAWGERQFNAIRRSDITALLDKIEDKHGQRQADYVLAVVRGICNWHATRTDDYTSPIARGMRRTDPKSRKRARTLDDTELRTVWKTAEQQGSFGAIVRMALLSAQRRDKVANMKWADLSDAGEWDVPAEDREKGTGGVLLLPKIALDIIREQPKFESNPYVFAGRGDNCFNGFSKCKAAFDLEAKIEPWVIHDLRRTSRSLMSRAGVRPDIAERVLGHVISGVAGVYDRHSYRDEKADALKRLAALVKTIINPPKGNVVSLPLAAAE